MQRLGVLPALPVKPRYLPTTEMRGVAITKTRKRSAFARWVRIVINLFWN